MNFESLNPFRYENMLLHQLRNTLTSSPIAIIPIGILEWHGNHNALGMDGLVAQHLCERVMTQLQRGVLMPLHWVGTYGYVHYEGTVCYEEETACQFLTQLLKQVVKLGFKLILLLSGHGGSWQQRAIQSAVKNALAEYRKPAKELNILGVVYPELAPEVKISHAGPEETAILWRIGQLKGIDLVDMQQHTSAPQNMTLYSIPDEKKVTIAEETIWHWNEIFPDPSTCSPDLGEKLLQSVSTGVLEEIKIYMEEMGLE
jgi:creatinine amidohydrolase/Fe(II)-dependent formamide hydrolase-like protein